MSESNTQAPARSAALGDEAKPPSGMEINLGDFTRTEGLMKSLRLTLNNNIVIPAEEIASGINDAGRKFKMGDLEQANLDVARLYSAFRQKATQWEAQARGLEQQMRMQASKSPKSISIDTMTRMKSEQVAVRTRIATAEVHFRRLHQGLDVAYTNLKSRSALGVPASFLDAIKAASPADRQAVVEQHFEKTTALNVTIRRATAGGYAIQFDPRPPLDGLLFVLATGEILRLHELAAVVVVEDFETGAKSDMKVAAFVKLVQGGVWLLQTPSSGP